MKRWTCRKYRNKAGIKTQEEFTNYRKIVIKKDYKTTLHLMSEMQSSLLVFLYHDFTVVVSVLSPGPSLLVVNFYRNFTSILSLCQQEVHFHQENPSCTIGQKQRISAFNDYLHLPHSIAISLYKGMHKEDETCFAIIEG